ncbi:expressed unknown protein [Seminavis robusta]|uniref:Uncharacterized protein n=1 Tax=Seminavis robusta TaxID=568900 RepID=A0A9N8H062_9STRA|nr:expressed unknown protein [Seminavis robusta]|eukprot:Sro15_g011070.1 n/a (486) ;mRNA; r:63724-65181
MNNDDMCYRSFLLRKASSQQSAGIKVTNGLRLSLNSIIETIIISSFSLMKFLSTTIFSAMVGIHAVMVRAQPVPNLRVEPERSAVDGEQQQRHVRHRHLISTIRTEYTADIHLNWEAENYMTQINADTLTDTAQSFITRNIPTNLPGEVMADIGALGILSVSIIGQTLDLSVSPSVLWVMLRVEGVVIAENDSFNSDSFNFTGIVETAIHSRNQEFLRQTKPLLVSRESVENEGANNSSSNIVTVAVSISVVFAVVALLVAVRVYQKWRDSSSTPYSMDGHKGPSDEAKGDNQHDNRPEESVDEQSIYTLRESAPPPPPPKNGSPATVVPPSEEENGGYLFNSFLGWSFSMSSDGNSCEFDTTSTDDNPPLPPKRRYTIENVDDISIGRDVDVFEDNNSQQEEQVSSRQKWRSRQPSPMEYTDSEAEDNAMDNSGRLSMDTSGRLSVQDMENFDNYVANLPAPYKHQSRKITKKEEHGRRELYMV